MLHTKHPPLTRRPVVTHVQLERCRPPAPPSLTSVEAPKLVRCVPRCRMILLGNSTKATSAFYLTHLTFDSSLSRKKKQLPIDSQLTRYDRFEPTQNLRLSAAFALTTRPGWPRSG